MLSIFVISDEYAFRIELKDLLDQHGYNVRIFSDISECIEQIKSGECDLILSDLNKDNNTAENILKSVKSINPNIEVIFFTESESIELAASIVKLGAFDYMQKPIIPDNLLIKVERALGHKRMIEEIERLQENFKREYGLQAIVAESKEMLNVLREVTQVAKSDSPILIQGESGTGKELIARAIHSSGRPGKPFIPINCGAMPETLLESELFGYMKGAFTGARINKKGLFEEAHDGTIFMDEIGDMPLITQVKILRALDFGEIRRLGSNTPIYVNTRIVAATNKDMLSLVKDGKFREDLYYRLNVISIKIPPLRERKSDIIPLANHFLKLYSARMGKDVKKISHEVRQILLKYDWPGNVRELENVIERAIVLAQYDTIFPDDLPTGLQSNQPDIIKIAIEKRWSLKELEKEYLSNVIKNYSGNLSKAVETLGIARNTLWRKMKKFGIK
ncbi:TPA: sigma-54-dependent Fis family transcriptional regulator [Candidatus Poribacteria bacterium]|nr:sigma-54-dependent Fis family transcriptional regulator [Candidatus Poribacteria bacterium]